ncbi:MAG: DUF167 domain-containing protein [Candidatus Margulisiibacteriota bacterium]
MKLNIKVFPRASKNRIIEENGRLKVYVTSPAVDGKANKAVIESLAEHFDVRKRSVIIVSGEKSREKTVEILE